jgi:biopolymer transport protein ExbD
MQFIPEDKLKASLSINLAPMIDFLFLMLAFFATIAVTRATIFDTKLNIVKIKAPENQTLIHPAEQGYQINLSIADNGQYKWMTEIKDYNIENIEKIKKELVHQHSIGLLPEDKSQTDILLHIDKNAPWEPIAKLIFAIRETGFDARPIFEPDKK